MRAFTIREAKTHLSRLIDLASKGESFVITKAGKPLVKVVALGSKEAGQQSLELLAGPAAAPKDFDQVIEAEIEKLFNSDL